MKSLEGKTILVTRPASDADEFVGLLRDEKARVILFPTIMTVPPESWQQCDEAIRNLARYDGIVFTSRNAARFFLERVQETDGTIAATATIFSIGPKTAEVVASFGLDPVIVESDSTSRSMAKALLKNNIHHLLLPKGNLASTAVSDILGKSGVQVTEVCVYRTEKAPAEGSERIEEALQSGTIDILTFFSPSSFHNFLDVVSAESVSAAAIAAVGPTTARAVREAGFGVHIIAHKPTGKNLVDAIVRYYRKGQKVQ